MQNFIPSFHFVNPEKKLHPEWCWDAVQWCWYNSSNRSLLNGKNIIEIEGYSKGHFDMTPFKNMYKSHVKELAAQAQNNPNMLNSNDTVISDAIGFVPLPLIPTKLNSAISIVQKIPVEVTATAQDPLAAKKKEEDLAFLKNKAALEADLDELAAQMNVGKLDLGTTKHSAVPFSDSPYGLDLAEPDELQVFVDLLYNLSVEAAIETISQEFWELKKCSQIKLLEIKDQLKFGVSCHRAYQSSLTALPDIEYEYPASVETPYSELPDKSDNTHRFLHKRVSVLELFNYFGNEICNKETLYQIINAKKFGYCACNNLGAIDERNFNQFKVNLIYCEIKSIDYVGVAPINKKSDFTYPVTGEESEKCDNKVWGQNTYGFWWLRNTRYFFGIHRLGFSHRTVGIESYQNFSTNIYQSQYKSAVELSIGENKKAQIADIKMQHAIIMSLPAGKYIDLKYLRGALSGLKKEENNTYTLDDLISLAFEKNIIIGDTEEFEEAKNGGQYKPFTELPGGVKSEVVGYMQVIADASSKISQFTGINDQLTGQSQSPEGLIGLEKLRINASINALNYVNEAITNQYQQLFSNWATVIQEAIKKGGKAKEAIVNLIGSKKVSLIESLDEIPLHSIGIKVTINQREEEKQEFRNELNRLKINGVINTVDEYMLSAVSNPKDRMALLAVKYKQWQKREQKKREEDMAQQQAMIASQGENLKNAVREKTSGEIQKIYAQGDTNAHILKLASQLGIQDKQIDFMGKKALQRDRGTDQLDKSIQTLETKQNLESQKPLPQ